MTQDLVKPIAGVLMGDPSMMPEIKGAIEEKFGKIDIVGDWIPFDHTTYYADEMGDRLVRAFVSFEKLVEPSGAAAFKAISKEIEGRFMKGGLRSVNIDPGYLDANKVVLVTGKHGGHKIALSPGVWADMLLWYNKGWVALPWAFPDFRDGRLFPLFVKIRRRYKEQAKGLISMSSGA